MSKSLRFVKVINWEIPCKVQQIHTGQIQRKAEQGSPQPNREVRAKHLAAQQKEQVEDCLEEKKQAHHDGHLTSHQEDADHLMLKWA